VRVLSTRLKSFKQVFEPISKQLFRIAQFMMETFASNLTVDFSIKLFMKQTDSFSLENSFSNWAWFKSVLINFWGESNRRKVALSAMNSPLS